ncbi:alanine/glycine:cation symporter family protein [Gracilibacillus thailandensis]|jgi:alanine or glycine:cation symporter, AGCS family|uniref:Amino acid carrier protein n=1 Tax=Gracilibacillus thailandensis TaxID=563735 RepID=A0A6N7R113_9BACI|nr:sodium:alanine symporter family protein [Gracilibacillus thailandensis]MRI66851.1 amino acid carrier protein [Gracilibacillus thailandensis]
MDFLLDWLSTINEEGAAILGEIGGWVWGPPLLILLVGTGLYLTFRLVFLQFKLLPYALKLAFSKNQDKSSKGDISHYQALTTAMAATIGTGNIAGVATAVVAGGPGAVFWMWITALVGMATKYAEALLAVRFRVENENGEMSGGPMYYLERGLKNKPIGKFLGVLFAIFASIAAFGIGNMVQSNTAASSLEESFSISPFITGIVFTVLAALVIIGGIKSIGKVTAFFVPVMGAFYILGGLILIVLNFDLVPGAISFIFEDAFTGSAVGGGILGTVIRYGVARGVFSNEAGLGSAPIAAAAARTDYPARQALVSMTQVFFDTIIVCSITGITIVMAGQWDAGLDGSALTSASFAQFLGTSGSYIVTFGILFFTFSTILGWSYYGEKSIHYLMGAKGVRVYRYIFIAFVFIGAVVSLDVVFNFSDVMNGLMAFPNLIGLLALSGIVVAETNKFLKVKKEEK